MNTNFKSQEGLSTPISYYGGKQGMLRTIIPMLPKHTIYVEPFFGGGAVFWAKEPIKNEIINDANGMVMNFYQQLKTNFEPLKQAIDATPYSREAYKQAMVVYNHPYLFTPMIKAWAFWVGTIQGFSNQIGSWRSSTVRCKEALTNFNKKEALSRQLADRLDLTQIECMDAVKLIKTLDTADTFFYIDPPYVGSDCGHYGGYTQAHFDELLAVLVTLKGKFLLSSYPNEKLLEMRNQHGWHSNDTAKSLSASAIAGKSKVECLTFNYHLNQV